MPSVMKFVADTDREPPATSNQSFLVTFSGDELAIICEAALLWKFDKERSIENIISSGIVLLRELLPTPGHPRPPEIH